MPSTFRWHLPVVGVAMVCFAWSGVSAQPLDVSPVTGYVTFTQRDHDLVTPLGRAPFMRTYRQDAPQERGWSHDIVSWLETAPPPLIMLRQGSASVVLKRLPGSDVLESADGVRATRREGGLVVEFPDGAVRRFDARGREVSRADANGNAASFTWDANGRLETVRAVDGMALTIRYDAGGRPASVTDALGRQARYEYDAANHLVRATDADGWRTTYEYDGAGRLAGILLPDGETVRLAYDAQNRVVEQRSTRHPGLTYTYTPTVTRVTRHDGYWRETVFDGRRRLVEARDSTGRSERWTWDDQGRIAAHTLPDGSTRRSTYDALGRTIAEVSDKGETLQIAYEGRSPRPASITLNGATTRYEYDARGNLLSITSPAGRVDRFTYDAVGRVVSQADGEGRTTRFEYDAAGRLVRQVNADGGVQSWAYDAAGRVTRSVDPAGGVTASEYDARGLRVATVGPDGVRSTVRYDAVGRPVAESGAGQTFEYSYDPAGRLAGIQYPGGTSVALGYDSVGRPATWTDPLGGVTRKEYDQLGRLVKSTGPGGLAATSTHDAAGRLAAIGLGQASGGFSVDPDGRTVRFTAPGGGETRMVTDPFGRVVDRVLPGGGVERRTYDADGLLQTVTLPAGDTWWFAYDRSGLLTETRYPDGSVERRTYDAMGRLAGMVLPWGGTLGWRYDQRGLVVEQTNARGEQVAYDYDQAGRVTRKRTPQDTWTYSYDANGNLVLASNGRFTTRHSYDRSSRLVATDIPEWQQTIAYQYDAHDRLVARTGPGSATVRYSYDALGRLMGVVDGTGATFSFGYDREGRLAERRAPNGTLTTYAYDPAGRTSAITHKDASGRTIASRRYAFDPAGALVTIEDEGSRETTMVYDADGRLTGEQAAASNRVVAYGPAGNRISTNGPAGIAAYAYDTGGRLIQAGGAAFAYDADGNVVSRTDASGTTRYAYDAENNLVRVELPGGQRVSYGYGPAGERISRGENETTTRFLLDSHGTLAELTSDGRARALYLSTGLDQTVLVSSADGTMQVLHEDALGGVIAVTDGQGRVAARHAVDMFGNPQAPTDAPASPPSSSTVRFAGRPLDPATGLYDMRARFYDPRLGRFLSRDPEPGEPGTPFSFPAYVYAGNNPVRYVDPLGARFYINARGNVWWYPDAGEIGVNPDARLYETYMNPEKAEYSPRVMQRTPQGLNRRAFSYHMQMDRYRHNGEVIRRVIGEEAAREWQQRFATMINESGAEYNARVNAQIYGPFDPRTAAPTRPQPAVPPGAPAPGRTSASPSPAPRASSVARTSSVESTRRAAGRAGVAAAGSLAIGAADVFGETYDVNTGWQDGARQAIKDRAANAAGEAVRALPMMAGGAALTGGLGLLAPATVPIMAGGGAVLAMGGLTVLAAERVLAAGSEARRYGVATGREEEILRQQEHNAHLRRLRQDFDELLAGVRARLDQLNALRPEAQAAFDEIKQAELDAANAGEAFNTAYRQVQEAIGEAESAFARVRARLEAGSTDAADAAQAANTLKTLEELKNKACGIPPLVSSASAENQQNLVREAARLAGLAEAAAAQAAAPGQAAASVEPDIAAQKDAVSRAESVWRERGDGRTALSGRLAIIGARLATMRRAVALQAEIVSECGRLRLFTDDAAEVDAVRQQAYAAVPPVAEAEALQRSVQARLDEVTGRQTAMDENVRALTAAWSALEQAQRERAASRTGASPETALALARQARECAERAAALASPRPAQTAQPAGQPPDAPPGDARQQAEAAARGSDPVKEQGGFKYYGDETRKDPGGVKLLGVDPQAPGGSSGGVKQQGGFTYFGGTTQPVRQTTWAAGSPTGWHVFATGSRLGWAGGLGRYSVGPADASIVEHLQAAGEHARMANQESRPPMLAWPGWAQMRESFRGWADNLQRNPSNNVRRQIAVSTSGNISGYAQVLNNQMSGIVSGDTCEAFYVRLGFHLGYGSQVMQIADEAVRNGDRRAAQEPRADAISHLNTVASLLNDYDRIVLASGSCADLREVRALLQRLFALNVNDVGAQAATATQAWELANRLIASFRGPGSQPAARPAQTTNVPPTGSARPAAALPTGSSSAANPLQALLDDPGELRGSWAGGDSAFRFVKQGDEYIGGFEENPWKEFGYIDNEVVFRGRRTGPNRYDGTFRLKRISHYVNNGGGLQFQAGDQQESVKILVLGNYLYMRSASSRPVPGRSEQSYTEVDFTCTRITGQRPWTTLGGQALDPSRPRVLGRLFNERMWMLAKGRGADGTEYYITYPALQGFSRRPYSGGITLTAQDMTVFEAVVQQDPLSAALVNDRGFVPGDGFRPFRVVTLPGEQPSGGR